MNVRVLNFSRGYFILCCSPFSLFISRRFWLSDAVRALLAWRSESLIPVEEEEIRHVFPVFCKDHAPI
jgi:hypothetical protein